MESIDELIRHILRFSPKLRHLNDGASEAKIVQFENTYQLELPSDFKAFLLIANGIALLESTVFGIFDESVPVSLNGAYKYEHLEVENKMPKYLVPFSPDGRGNHYCFDCSTHLNDSCKVVFWEYDVLYDVNDPPEIVDNSFTEWAQQVLVDWKLLDINYDGTMRKD
jgi:cell wall assembly regulator SMI1